MGVKNTNIHTNSLKGQVLKIWHHKKDVCRVRNDSSTVQLSNLCTKSNYQNSFQQDVTPLVSKSSGLLNTN